MRYSMSNAKCIIFLAHVSRPQKSPPVRAGWSSVVSALSGRALLFQLCLSLQLIRLGAELLQRIQHSHDQVADLAFRGAAWVSASFSDRGGESPTGRR